MNRMLLIAAFVVLAAFVAPSAHAQLQPMNNSTCPADMSYNQCIANGYTSTSGGGSGSTSSGCGTVNSLNSCLSACDCQYQKNLKNKCGSTPSLACRQLYMSEREACQGNCITDWN